MPPQVRPSAKMQIGEGTWSTRRMSGVSLLIALVAIFLVDVSLVSAAPKRLPTLDDAYAVKSVGAIDATADLVAFESDSGLEVVTLHGGKHIKQLDGDGPSWSPDGSRLAYFSRGSDRQLHVWDRQSDRSERVSDIPGGIVSGVLTPWCLVNQVSWAPDSVRVIFATQLLDDRRYSTSLERQGIRFYDSNSPLDHTILEGVFSRESFRDTYPGTTDDIARKKAADINPSLARTYLVVADTRQKSWSVLSGKAFQYGCADWSPDGRYVATAAEWVRSRRVTGFGWGLSAETTSLVLRDMLTDKERRVDLPVEKVEAPRWSPDSSRILLLTEKNSLQYSFAELALFSLSDSKIETIPTPGGLQIEEVRWSSANALVLKLMDGVGNSLWRLDLKGGHSRRVSAPAAIIDSFAETPTQSLVLNTQGGSFKGRVFTDHSARAGWDVIYDANPQLVDLDLGQQTKITWTNSTGEEVDGLLILPPSYQPGRRYPVIVNAYPGQVLDRLWLEPRFESTGQLQASWGYVIFRPAIRPPHAVHRWTYTRGRDYTERARGVKGIPIAIDDFQSGIDLLVKQGIADPNQIGMFGHSNGGWVVNLMATETSIVKAAVVSSGMSNAVLMNFFPLPKITNGVDPSTGGNIFDNTQDYVRMSPIFRMRDTKVPMLLVVGDQDWPWVPQMISQYGVLRGAGKDVQLVRYAKERHTLSARSSIEDALARMKSFFDRHINYVGRTR